jgi:GNAT superfamily N-acetyltransferase
MSNSLSTDANTIRRLLTVTDEQVGALAELLIDCVDGGASVSFMHPLPLTKATEFWRRVADAVVRGERALLLAEDAGGVVGTVQLVLDQPDNQPHRADLSKMLVHRRARCQGLGAALMRAAENLGRECGKSLLVLDTVTGSDAERLYAQLGWQRCGVIPGYALLPRGGLCATKGPAFQPALWNFRRYRANLAVNPAACAYNAALRWTTAPPTAPVPGWSATESGSPAAPPPQGRPTPRRRRHLQSN